MKHRGIVVPVFLLLVALWLFVGARPIRLELSLAPTWIDVNGAELAPSEVGAPGLRTAAASGLSSVPSDDARPPVPLLLDGTLFYVDPAAGVTASHQIPEFVAAGSEAFIGYSGVAENHLLQRTDGEIVGRVAVSGAPFVVNDRFFVVAPFQDGVAALDVSGRLLWRVRYPAIVLDLDHTAGITAVGLSDGTVRLLNEAGTEANRVHAAGLLESGTIHGVALSSEGAFLATALSDGEGAYGAVFDLLTTPRTPPVFDLGPGVTGPVRVEFLSDDRLLTYGSSRALTLVRLFRTPEIRTIEMFDLVAFGAVFGNEEWEGLVYALEYPDGMPTLLLLTPEGRRVAETALHVTEASVTGGDAAIVVAGVTEAGAVDVAALEPRLR